VAEPEGFREFVAARSAALVRSALLLTGDEAMAQDLVQTALVKTWSRWASVARRDAPEAYVRRVLVSTFLTWSRRRWHGEHPVAVVPDRAGVRDELADADLRGCVSSALGVLPRPAAGRRRAAVLRRPDRGSDGGCLGLFGRHRQEPGVEGAGRPSRLPQLSGLLDGEVSRGRR
jgi:DNA-directed RNA polymerase specialized sigma24 family protein